MNEMIPRSNTVPAEKTSQSEEVVLDPEKFTAITELAPNTLSLEEIGADLGAAVDAAADYPALMDILEAAIANHGHQTVETVMLARFNNEPTENNRAYLKLIGGINETQTIPAIESYTDPAFEGMELLLEVINKYTQEEIDVVTNITTPAEAFASPERKRMKDDIAPVYKLACKLRWETKADLDTDHTVYPEFWQIFSKLEAMHQAVGVINMIEKNVRHDLTIK